MATTPVNPAADPGLPPMPVKREPTGWPDDNAAVDREYQAKLVKALRARLALAVLCIERYAGACDSLHHDKAQFHDWTTPCPVEAQINSVLKACQEAL